MKILLLNGPNLNMLGKRNPELYGRQTLKELEKQVCNYAKLLGVKVVCRRSNSEGKLIDILQNAKCDAVIINAGAYSHYSYALRDCIECASVPVVEVHMTDVYAREEFRHTDVLKDVCKECFVGGGVRSYLDAVAYLANL